MRIARLLLHIPGNWVSDVSRKCNASIRVMKCVPWEKDRGRSIVRIETKMNMDGESLMDSIRSVSPRCKINLVSSDKGTHIAAVTNSACVVCGALSETNCFLDNAISQPDGRVAWTVIAPSSKNLSNLVEKLQEVGCEVEMTALRNRSEESVLTYHQETIVRMAYDLGYYDIPRRMNLDEFSARVGISKSTLAVILRRAERKLIADHIDRL
ncbi:MAG TPA: helix-turn-helix domain-containing protein [Methanomassiliicoccales archaeon]|nr:helix-turn-helix domain-containing protein [Methanomassiliicoccales archaeon]